MTFVCCLSLFDELICACYHLGGEGAVRNETVSRVYMCIYRYIQLKLGWTRVIKVVVGYSTFEVMMTVYILFGLYFMYMKNNVALIYMTDCYFSSCPPPLVLDQILVS